MSELAEAVDNSRANHQADDQTDGQFNNQVDNLVNALENVNINEDQPVQQEKPEEPLTAKIMSPIFFTEISKLLEERVIPKPMEKFDESTVFPREILKRVRKEIADVNNDFFNLRTVIIPDPDDDINTFYYLMIPNDGAYCQLPLIGRVIIVPTYPADPPVFHLLTRTGRFNVDVYNSAATTKSTTSSSMCFDILKAKTNGYYQEYSSWNENYTLSAVFSALMQSLVSVQVPQMHGGETTEFVTMESLAAGYQNVISALRANLKYVGAIPEIPGNFATEIPATKNMKFPAVIEVRPPATARTSGGRIQNSNKSFDFQIESIPLRLQSGHVYSCAFDLSELTSNYVFSAVLTTNPQDLVGKRSETILFRNGVTATAAKKLVGTPIQWFYHGKPLNQGKLKLAITITDKEFTMAYSDESTADKWVIHGDYPLCLLDCGSVGNLYNRDFYLVLYLKRKSGENIINIRNLNLTTGYVQ